MRKNRLLRGEAKLAWYFLWRLLGGRPGTLRTSPVDVGADQGGDKRAGLRALKALELGGFIEVSDRRDGVWIVYVVEPAELEIARRRPHDPQTEMWPGHDEGGGADVAQHPPHLPSKKEPFKSPLPSLPSPPNLNLPSEAPKVKTLGALAERRAIELTSRMPRQANRELERSVEEWMAVIQDGGLRVGAEIRDGLARRVAAAIVAGELDPETVNEAFADIAELRESGQLKSAFALFHSRMKQAFLRNPKLHWPKRRDEA